MSQYTKLQGNKTKYMTTQAFFARQKNDAIRNFRAALNRNEEVVLTFDGTYWKIAQDIKEIK